MYLYGVYSKQATVSNKLCMYKYNLNNIVCLIRWQTDKRNLLEALRRNPQILSVPKFLVPSLETLVVVTGCNWWEE